MNETPNMANKSAQDASDSGAADRPTEHTQLLEWWGSLESHRGDRAALRRAATLNEVLFNPSFHRLRRVMRESRWAHAERLAQIATLAARISEPRFGASFASQLGKPEAGKDKPPLSGLRFRRLLQARDPEELTQLLTRAIALLGGKANLYDLAESVYWWNDGVRRQWAFDYYDANPKAD